MSAVLVGKQMSLCDSSLELCQQEIGYNFKDIQILEKAFIHASVADDRLDSNERLEFLGDAILGMVVCHELFCRFPDYLEGELTKIKSMIVSRRTCARLAKEIGLTKYLQVGKGMASQIKLPNSCAAAVMESIIGAIFIDGGPDAARDFILRHIGPLLDKADAGQHQGNFKSMLQQYSQRIMDATPVYEVLDEKGPDHSKCFKIAAQIGNARYQAAWGRNKKEAEQRAARNALSELKGEVAPFPSDD